MSKYFDEEEMLSYRLATEKGINNKAEDWQKENLKMLFDTVCDPIREIYGKPLTCGNAFRGEELNESVGGVGNSSHKKGLAADLWIPDNLHIAMIRKILKAEIPFHTLIYYPKRGFIHVDIRGGTKDTPRTIRVSKDGGYPEVKIV